MKPGYWRLQLVFGWWVLASTAPAIYLWVGLPLILRGQGWSGVQIGVLQLAGLPVVIKWLLAMPVERYRPRRGHYKAWTLALAVPLGLVLLALSWPEVMARPPWLFALAGLFALLATWLDVPLGALAIRRLPPSQRLRAGAVRSAALSLAAILGGGVMLLIQDRWGWAAPFMAMAGLLAVGLLLLAPVSEQGGTAVTPEAKSGASLNGYFRRPGLGVWQPLLIALFPCLGAAWVFLKPLMLDHGFSVPQVAWWVGVVGGLVAAAAGGLAPAGAVRLGVGRWLVALALFDTLVLAGLGWAVSVGVPGALVAGALAVAAAMGATAALMFALMMHYARRRARALDYGLQASLFGAGRLLAPLGAGWLLDRAGYAGMLAGLVLVMGLMALYALGVRRRLPERLSPPSAGAQ